MTDNSEQAEFWNGRMGADWVSVEANIDQMLGPLTAPAIEALAPAAGEQIIDIGCGCGTTSMMIAERGADVWGIDISEPMINQANSKPPAAGGSLRFTVGDAASQSFNTEFDALFSRFGIMFFSDPEAALANLRNALKPGGRIAYLCWQAPASNPWISMVGQALQPYQPADTPPPDPTAPGPFSMADPEKTSGVLSAAGFSNIAIEPVERDITLGRDVDEAMAFQRHVGPLSGLLAATDASMHEELVSVVRDVLSSHLGDNGIVVPAAAWLVTGENHG